MLRSIVLVLLAFSSLSAKDIFFSRVGSLHQIPTWQHVRFDFDYEEIRQSCADLEEHLRTVTSKRFEALHDANERKRVKVPYGRARDMSSLWQRTISICDKTKRWPTHQQADRPKRFLGFLMGATLGFLGNEVLSLLHGGHNDNLVHRVTQQETQLGELRHQISSTRGLVHELRQIEEYRFQLSEFKIQFLQLQEKILQIDLLVGQMDMAIARLISDQRMTPVIMSFHKTKDLYQKLHQVAETNHLHLVHSKASHLFEYPTSVVFTTHGMTAYLHVPMARIHMHLYQHLNFPLQHQNTSFWAIPEKDFIAVDQSERNFLDLSANQLLQCYHQHQDYFCNTPITKRDFQDVCISVLWKGDSSRLHRACRMSENQDRFSVVEYAPRTFAIHLSNKTQITTYHSMMESTVVTLPPGVHYRNVSANTSMTAENMFHIGTGPRLVTDILRQVHLVSELTSIDLGWTSEVLEQVKANLRKERLTDIGEDVRQHTLALDTTANQILTVSPFVAIGTILVLHTIAFCYATKSCCFRVRKP